MSSELKPCPFCGGESKIEQCEPSTARFNEGAVHFRVSCPSVIGEHISGCIGSQLNHWEITPEDAVEKWNKRVIPEGYQLMPIRLLAEISSMCIGQMSMNIPIDPEYIGRRIYEETGLTEPEQHKAARHKEEIDFLEEQSK